MSDPTSHPDEFAELVAFVRFSLKEGLTVEQIRESLLESGQPANRISMALDSVLRPASPLRVEIAPPQNNSDASLDFECSSPELELLSKSADLPPSAPADLKSWVEPKIELMAFPQSGARQAASEKRPRNGMTDRELIHAYKAALKRKAEKKLKKQQFDRLVFLLGVGAVFAAFLFLFRR